MAFGFNETFARTFESCDETISEASSSWSAEGSCENLNGPAIDFSDVRLNSMTSENDRKRSREFDIDNNSSKRFCDSNPNSNEKSFKIITSTPVKSTSLIQTPKRRRSMIPRLLKFRAPMVAEPHSIQIAHQKESSDEPQQPFSFGKFGGRFRLKSCNYTFTNFMRKPESDGAWTLRWKCIASEAGCRAQLVSLKKGSNHKMFEITVEHNHLM